jgi:pyridoxine kinase
MFSNHTGYANGFKGDILNGAQLENLVQGLKNNSLLEQTSHLLTGYIGSMTFLESVVAVFTQLKEANPNLIYVCDPVTTSSSATLVFCELLTFFSLHLHLCDSHHQAFFFLNYICLQKVLGDNGKLYVPQELVAVYRARILNIATVLTPNQFECEQVIQLSIHSLSFSHSLSP